MDFTEDIDSYLQRLKGALDLLDRKAIQAFLDVMVDALENDRDIYVFGNGGSAANASHFTVDIGKGASKGAAKRFRLHCLNDNMPTLTAYANDFGYETVFVEPLRNFLRREDLVIALSGSGNSKNVVLAVEYAKSVGATVVGITGYSGGALRALSDISIHLPLDDMQLAEDIQLVVTHVAMRAIGTYQGLEGCKGR